MEPKHNKNLVSTSRILRKNMTKEERHLWYDYLRNYPVRIRRQKVIGKYIVDFYCAEAKLVIEVDGIQHNEDNTVKKDTERTLFLKKCGVDVIRVSNYGINTDFVGTCMYIDNQIQSAINKTPQSCLRQASSPTLQGSQS